MIYAPAGDKTGTGFLDWRFFDIERESRKTQDKEHTAQMDAHEHYCGIGHFGDSRHAFCAVYSQILLYDGSDRSGDKSKGGHRVF